MSEPTTENLTAYQLNLVETHIGLAQNIGTSYWEKVSFVTEKRELIGVAYQGLINAALKFDPEYRPANDPKYDPFLAFGAYAKLRINGALKDWLRKLDYVPRRHRNIFNQIRNLMEAGTDFDAAIEKSEITVEKYREVARNVRNRPISLDSNTGSRATGKAQERERWEGIPLPDPRQGVEGIFTAQTVQQAVVDTIETMNPYDKSVIVLRYYLGYDFNQIAQELESSTSRVKAAHQEAVAILHNVMLATVQP